MPIPQDDFRPKKSSIISSEVPRISYRNYTICSERPCTQSTLSLGMIHWPILLWNITQFACILFGHFSMKKDLFMIERLAFAIYCAPSNPEKPKKIARKSIVQIRWKMKMMEMKKWIYHQEIFLNLKSLKMINLVILEEELSIGNPLVIL